MSNRFSPPDEDELEVSVFGPGKGECIVVKIPGESWIVVDSFLIGARGARVPVAVAYLNEFDIDGLSAFCLTHWHSDHTQGAALVLRRYGGRIKSLGLPVAFGEREFASFVGDLLPSPAGSRRVVADLIDVLNELKKPVHVATRRYTLIDGVRLPDVRDVAPAWSLDVLSPSFDDQRDQLATLAKLRSSPASSTGFDVNSGSAVLRVQVDGIGVVLLASDLDIGESPTRGWQHVTNNRAHALKCQVLKVGHHGSDTAFHRPAYAAMMMPDAVVTPFPAKNEKLPRSKMVTQIAAVTRTLHITARPSKATKAGNIALSDSPFSSYQRLPTGKLDSIGQIRYRMRPGETIPRVEIFHPGQRLNP